MEDIDHIIGQDASVPVAIVGVACRFPGDATNPENLWNMISHGRHARSEVVPESRFNMDSFYHPSGERRGNTNARGGYFLLEDVGLFDAPFWGITAQEAHAMDPQQRMALELSFEALENAGIPMKNATGSSIGCYMSSFTADWAAMTVADIDDYPRYFANAHSNSMLANRVSWFFNIKGPSMSLDTACSSSMVALHLACGSLRSGESKSALVGATNLILYPNMSVGMSSLNFLSPDSKSMAFDHKANGYARGEGAAVLVVKLLSDAIRDGDVIRAVIRETATNHDGRTPGINLPSAIAQEALIRAAYASAGLGTEETGYFEAHGTGTPAGDPLEMQAVANAIGKYRKSTHRLAVGSIKTNVGHLEGVAGLAGVIKAVYCLEKGQIPPNLWFEKANLAISLEEWGLHVPTELLPWPSTGLRRASINSFGYGGTNAHCILDDAYHYLQARGLPGFHNTAIAVPRNSVRAEMNSTEEIPSPDLQSDSDTPESSIQITSQHSSSESDVISNDEGSNQSSMKLLVWSSHEQSGIKKQTANLISYLESTEETSSARPDFLNRLAFTLSNRHTKLPWTSFVVAPNTRKAVKGMEDTPSVIRTPAEAPGLIFVFTGQGAQWYAMGRELLAYSLFRTCLEDATLYMTSLGAPWNLLSELQAEEQSSRIYEPGISQPACTALQVALIELLGAWGVHPDVTLGHSSGEIAAAYLKGAISREAAWKIAYHRGRLSESISEPGAMLAVGLGEDAIQPYLDSITPPSIACINSPSSITLSGSEASIAAAEAVLADKAINRRLFVKTAYHSSAMLKIADAYNDALIGLEQDTSDKIGPVHMVSSVSGEEIKNETLATPEYWVQNMVSPVKFRHAVEAVLKHVQALGKKSYVVVEIGPHGALQGPIKQTVTAYAPKRSKTEIPYISVLKRSQDATLTTLEAMGALYQLGVMVQVDKANQPDPKSVAPVPLVDLPPSPWVHNTRYWFESPTSTAFRLRKEPRHDLLGAICPQSSRDEPCWRNYLRLSELPWLSHHKLQNSILFPFSGMLATVIEAARQVADPVKTVSGIRLRDVSAGNAMLLSESEDEPRETRLQLRPWRNGSKSHAYNWLEFNLSSRTRDGTWTHHSTGLVSIEYETGPANGAFVDEKVAKAKMYRDEYLRIQASDCLTTNDTKRLYEEFAQMGSEWSDTFQGLRELRSSNSEAVGSVAIPDTRAWMPKNVESRNLIHPATLDSTFHLLIAPCGGLEKGKTGVPKFVESVFVSAKLSSEPGTLLHGYAKRTNTLFNQNVGDIIVSDDTWDEPMLIVEGFKSVEIESGENDDSKRQAKLVAKLGSYPCWDMDVVSSPPKALDIIKESCASEGATDYETVHDIEQAAYIICKRVTTRFSPENAQNFAPYHRLFYQYMQQQCELGSQGKLALQRPGWSDLDKESEQELLTRVEKTTLDGKLLCRVAENIERVLLGEVEPLQVLREDGLLDEFYRHGLTDGRSLAAMREYVKKLSHKRPLRILEVGAGTGGATFHLMKGFKDTFEASSHLKKYTYTDISAGYFEAAQERFKMWRDFFEYKMLDIERDPVEQGFEEGSYDVVVAFEVLHATSVIRNSLEHCKRLLKPGGQLLLIELTSTLARTPMAFGILPGWWLGESDGRHLGPRLFEEQWEAYLVDMGFSKLEWCLRDGDDGTNNMTFMSFTLLHPTVEQASKFFVVTPMANPVSSTESLTSKLIGSLKYQGIEAEELTLNSVAKIDMAGTSFIVLDTAESLTSWCQAEDFAALQRIITKSESMLWITQGAAMDGTYPEASLFTGLFRTARTEDQALRLSTLDIDPNRASNSSDSVDAILRVMDLQKDPSRTEVEFAERGGILYIERIYPGEQLSQVLDTTSRQDLTIQPIKQPGRPLRLEMKTRGALDTFWFDDDSEFQSKPLGDLEVEVEVKAVGLNLHDLANAMGQIWDEGLGVEYSGVVTCIGAGVTRVKPGDRVMSVSLGWYRTFLRNDEALFQKIPDNLTFEDASTMVISYLTAVYSVCYAGRLQRGESILIHSAASGVGRTSIELAKRIGAEVFATVSSEDKKQFLVEQYGVPEDHIFSSRDLGFADGIHRVTEGRGVDVILNTMINEGMRQTWHCIAPFGRCLELGMRDIESNTGLDMAGFANNCSYQGVNVMKICEGNPRLFGQLMADVMRYYADGVITLVGPVRVMKFSEITDAFHTIQSRKRIGKTALSVLDDDLVSVVPRKKAPVTLRDDATYFIPGGLGGLGRHFAKWMAERGARYLVFISRSGTKDPRAKAAVEELNKMGVKTMVFATDIVDEAEMKRVLCEIEAGEFPPIKGAITFAMQIKDILFEDMSVEDYWSAVRPKYDVTRNMHNLLPKDMDFFICMSSIGGVVGSRGQGNYNAGNTYQDALMCHRNASGLCGTSICLGVVSDAGFASENAQHLPHFRINGTPLITVQQTISVIAAAIAGDVQGPQPIVGFATGGIVKAGGYSPPHWFSDTRLGPLAVHDTQDPSTRGTGAEDDRGNDLVNVLAEVQSLEEAGRAVCDVLIAKLAKGLMTDVADLDPALPANAYGVDSLVAVEVRAWARRDVQSEVSVFEILSNLPMRELALAIATKSALLPTGLKAPS